MRLQYQGRVVKRICLSHFPTQLLNARSRCQNTQEQSDDCGSSESRSHGHSCSKSVQLPRGEQEEPRDQQGKQQDRYDLKEHSR